MSKLVDTAETRLFRSIRNRKLLKGLILLVPAILLWRWLFHWIEYRFKIQDDLAQIGTLLVIASTVGVLASRFKWFTHDQRENPRLRWLQEEASERLRSRARGFWIFGLSGLFLSGLVTLLSNRALPTPVMGWGLIVMMMMTSQTVLWRLPKSMDELARAHYLTATRLAYLVTVTFSIAGLIINVYWPHRLPAMVTLSLLSGMLTHQLCLVILERRSVPCDD